MRHSHANTLSLTDATAVRRDADGVPIAFRVLRRGVNYLTIDGELGHLNLTDARMQGILDYHAMKGELIPIDAEHYLADLATQLGVDEADLIKNTPKLGEDAAEGLARLVGEADGIWAHVEKWSARARDLLKGTDQIYGYYSPAARGRAKPPLRLTSIALTNLPAMNGQDVLAARGEERTQNAMGDQMKTQIQKLAVLLGMDAVALVGEGADLGPLLTKALEQIDAGKAAIEKAIELMAGVKDPLALTDTDTLDTLQGKILAVCEKGKADALALTEARGRIAEFEATDKTSLVKLLKDEGKITDAMTPWAEKQDVAALREFAKTAAVIVKTGRETKADDKATGGGDAIALTAEGRKIAMACGQDPDEVAKVQIPKIGE